MKVQLAERVEDNMKYEYNGHLLEEERITLVANEIVNKYPQINIEQAKEAAMMEGRISTSKNLDIEFNRLYNIMLVINNDKENIAIIYNDMINVLNRYQDSKNINYYYNIVLEINKFLNNERDFPFL